MGDITRSTRKVMMDYDTRRQVEVFAEEAVHDFKNETPIFQKKIEDCLFCFEDFQYLDDRAIQKVLRDTDMQELAKALRGASTEVQNKIFRNMSQRAAAMLEEDIGLLHI